MNRSDALRSWPPSRGCRPVRRAPAFEFRAAVQDLSWLRSRECSGAAPQKLVRDRYQLKRRQRDAVARSARTDAERAHRLHARQSPRKVAGREVHIDAFNVLIPLEAALERAYLICDVLPSLRSLRTYRGELTSSRGRYAPVARPFGPSATLHISPAGPEPT